jgi:hypothetical protein
VDASATTDDDDDDDDDGGGGGISVGIGGSGDVSGAGGYKDDKLRNPPEEKQKSQANHETKKII